MRVTLSGALAIGWVLVAPSLATAATHAIVQPKIKAPDNVTRPALVDFVKSVQTPTIVLRVPAPQTSVSQAQGEQGNAGLNRAYLAIEKELVKAGFIVRDRGLLEEILRSNQNLDYRLIREKINAQLILELVSIAEQAYDTTDYVDAKTQQAKKLKSGSFSIRGWRFESRIVMVDSGEIGGIYAGDVVPQDLHFVVAGRRIFNASLEGKIDKSRTGYGFGPVEHAAPFFLETLILALKPELGRARLGAAVVPATKATLKKLGLKFTKNLQGVLVTSVIRQSRAAEAGLILGDVIDRINGQPVATAEDVLAAVKAAGSAPMTLAVTRGGKALSLTVPSP